MTHESTIIQVNGIIYEKFKSHSNIFTEMKKKLFIGIDTGTFTGMALWYPELKILKLETLKIHQAMLRVKELVQEYGTENTFIRFEDARLRKWFGSAGREQLQGAGSIKRDCVIWQDFLNELNADYQAVAPRNNRTKLTSTQFNKLTGFVGVSTEHSRDAGMLVWGL